MRVAIIGPLCKDEVILKGRKHSQLGGAVYYIGQALSLLGVQVTAFASFGREPKKWLAGFRTDELIRIPTEGTMKFVNEYPDSEKPDYRTQRAEILKNEIRFEDIKDHDLSQYDDIVLAPLFHNNLSVKFFHELSNFKTKTALSAQGMIRYLEEGKIVWRNPEQIIKVLPFINYLFLDESELEFVTGKKIKAQGAEVLKSRGLENLVVTNGGRGSTLFLKEKSHNIKAFPPLKLMDPTGAGDSYLAGFLKAKELFKNPQQQGEFAAMTATISIENRGAFNKNQSYVLNRLGYH